MIVPANEVEGSEQNSTVGYILFFIVYHYFQMTGQSLEITLFLTKVAFNYWKKMVTVKNIVRS